MYADLIIDLASYVNAAGGLHQHSQGLFLACPASTTHLLSRGEFLPPAGKWRQHSTLPK